MSPKSKPAPAYLTTHGHYGKLGGRPRKDKAKAYLKDEGQAFEVIKNKWAELADLSVDEALRAVRDDKTDPRKVVGKTTAAAIAYDKRWEKKVSDNTEIAVPPSLAKQIVAKLTATGSGSEPQTEMPSGNTLESQETLNMVQAEPCITSDRDIGMVVGISEASVTTDQTEGLGGGEAEAGG